MSENAADRLSGVVLSLQERLRFFWHFYFASCLALLAFVASVTDGSRRVAGNAGMKAAVSLLFVMFVAGNAEGLVKFSRRLREASGLLQRTVEGGHTESAAGIISRLSFRLTLPATIVGHVIGDSIILASVWFCLNPK